MIRKRVHDRRGRSNKQVEAKAVSPTAPGPRTIISEKFSFINEWNILNHGHIGPRHIGGCAADRTRSGSFMNSAAATVPPTERV